MSRVARVVVPGFPHHITQRGNRRADIFETDGDRKAYLRFLKQYADKRGLDIWAYCLMTNHIHLVAVPKTEAALGFAMRDTHTVYAMYFNSRTQLSGHVWQGRTQERDRPVSARTSLRLRQSPSCVRTTCGPPCATWK